MPIGIQRLNARHQHPTPHIIFIKPLPGPSAALAEDFLSRVAAICHPILKAHHLSIMSLEEYEPNPEFIGRNFNAGEVIQLVLKTRSGAWMDFRSVVMVMMHELAHCRQMNHSGAFWKVRNGFVDEIRGLWAQNYTGEGVWGPGRTVAGELQRGVLLAAEEMPRALCGGTYRSGWRRKRKRNGATEGQKLSYAERQQRRIAKKFGVAGVALGDDEETKIKLENGKRVKAKPRVAGSARGRELRAAAALARFGQRQEVKKKEESGDDSSDTDSDYDDVGVKGEEAIDINGSKLLDSKGHGMVKVCENEDSDDINVKEEMQELQDLNKITSTPTPGPSRVPGMRYTPTPGPSSVPSVRYTTIPRPSRVPRVRSSSASSSSSSCVETDLAPVTPQRRARKLREGEVFLGDDEETRIKLEGGMKVKNSPRVAQSARGRMLRGAAADARFGQQQEVMPGEENAAAENGNGDIDNENDNEDPVIDDADAIAITKTTTKFRYVKGHGLVKVSELANLSKVKSQQPSPVKKEIITV